MSGAIPGFGIIFDILYITPFLLPILIGFFAERNFKTKLYGRLADIAIGLVGGIGLYAVAAGFTSNYNNAVARKFYSDLYAHGIDTYGKFPPDMLSDRLVNVIFTIAAVIGAFVLLYAARLIFRRRVQNISAPVQAPTVAMAPSVPMAPSVTMAPSVAMAPSAVATPAASPAPARPTAASSDVMEQIKKLGELHAAGILTDSEFATKKAELLTRL